MDPERLPLSEYRKYLRDALGYDPLRIDVSKASKEHRNAKQINEELVARGFRPLPQGDPNLGTSPSEASARFERTRLDRFLKNKSESDEAPTTTELEGEAPMARRKKFTDSNGMTHEPEAKVKGPSRPEQVFEVIQANGGATLKTIAESLQITRDAAWGATRNLIQAGRVKGMRQSETEREQIYVAIDA